MRHTISFVALALTFPLHQATAAEQPAFTPMAQLDLWATLWDQDEQDQADASGYGDPEHDPGFTIRRARFGLSGTNGAIRYGLLAGVSAPYDALSTRQTSMQLVDAYAGYTMDNAFGATQFLAGVSKVYFSREMMMSSTDLIFLERAVGTSWLNPNRDAGVTAIQDLDFGDSGTTLRLSVGTYNGNSDIFADTDPGLLYISRLEITHGDSYKTWSKEPGNAFGLGIAGLINDEVATSTKAANIDFLARVGALALLGEATYSVIAPADSTVTTPAVPAETKRLGMMLQASAYIPMGEELGLEPAFRIATYDDANHIKDNGDVSIMHGGLSVRDIVSGLDLGGAFIHRIEREGRSVKNDTLRLWVQTHL
jgi:hypothetical protein